MIPINLKISGLYSYLEEQEIDFTRLTEAGLFGIFGKVGSGKSTILEAMSFAIYSDTARFSKSGDNRYYNMLNLKSSEAVIDFTFKAGKENKIYNIYVRLLRNSKDFENVNLKDHNYYLVSGKVKKPIEGKIVSNEIGIDYDNFKRTVIIPQGQFKDFLDLKPTARTNMLKDLFGLQRFDLSSKLNLIDKKNISRLDVLSGEMLGKEGVTDELLKKIKNDSFEKEKTLKGSKKELQIKEDELKKYDSLEADFTNYNKKNNEYAEILKYSESYKAKEAEAKEFEMINSVFAGLVREIGDLTEDQSKRVKVRTELETIRANEAKGYEKIKIKFTDAEKAFKTNDALKDQAAKLFKLIMVIDIEARLEKLVKQISESSGKINKEIIEKQKILSEKIDGLEKENTELDKHGLEDTYILAMNAWYIELDFVDKSALDLNETQRQTENKIVLIRERMNKELRNKSGDIFKELADDFNEEEFNKAYSIFHGTLKNGLEKLQTLKSELDLKCRLQEYAGHLEDGHACVMCGSLEHPNPLSAENFDTQLKELADAINDNTKKDVDLRKVSDQILKGFAELKGLNELISATEVKIKNEGFKLVKLKDKQPKGEFGNANKTEFANCVKEIEESKKKIKLNTEKLFKHRETQKTLAADLDREKTLLDEMKAKYQTEKGSLLFISAELKNLDRTIYVGRSADEISAEAKSIELQIGKNVEAFETLTNEKRKSEDFLLAQQGKLNAEQKEIDLIHTKLEQASASFTEKLNINKMTEDVVRITLAKNLDIEAMRKEIEKFKETLNILLGEINALKEKTEGKTYDKSVHEAFKTKVNELKAKYEETNNDLITLKNEVTRLSAELVKKKQILEDFDKLTIRAADIASMKSLFKSSGFVDFVSRRYLQNVVSIANGRFYKMSRQKFKMELSEDGEFLVRDFMNEGKTRLLKSLSGGQTFQAALSLSLALSESIQRNAGVEQHFFFLDEGFGTLDKESLQLVFETLKSLRQENRVVGLISHVEELQQEMDVFLKIENDHLTGTQIKESWK
jgi:exonuclease SbcC